MLTSSISSPLPSTSLLHQIESITPLAILEEVSISTEELVENNHIHANKLYFQIINNQYSWIYPTVRQYQYDFDLHQITLLKERSVEENQRVWDFLEFNNQLFESVISFVNDELYGSVYINHELVWSQPIQDVLSAPAFSIQDGKMYLSPSFLQEGEVVSAVLEWQDSNLQWIWSSNQPNSKALIARSITQDDYSRLVFEAQSATQNQIYFLNNGQLQQIPFEKEVMRFQSLKEKVILFSSQDDFQTMEYHLLNVLELTITPIFSSNETIGLLNTGDGTINSFLFVNSNNATSLAFLNDHEITTQEVEAFPQGSCWYGTLNDQTNLVFINSYDVQENQVISTSSYYLVSLN